MGCDSIYNLFVLISATLRSTDIPSGVQSLDYSLEISYREQPPERVITGDARFLARECRDVVDAYRHVDTVFDIQLHRRRHVDIAVVVEGLGKVGFDSADIAEVYKENFVGERGDSFVEPLAHKLITGLTECDAEVRRADCADSALYSVKAREYARDIAEPIKRRVIGVQREPDVTAFGIRYHRFDEVFVVI